MVALRSCKKYYLVVLFLPKPVKGATWLRFFRPNPQKAVIWLHVSAQNQKRASVWQNNRLVNDSCCD